MYYNIFVSATVYALSKKMKEDGITAILPRSLLLELCANKNKRLLNFHE